MNGAAGLPVFRYRGLVYRGHNPRWAFAPVAGTGAARHGGRFNPRGVPALYASLRPETAWLEAQQGLPFKAQPLTICAYRVDCADLVDLTQPAALEAAGSTRAELACAWEALAARGETPPSWALADRLRAAGYAGVVVPSFAPGATDEDVNLVFWDWGEDLPHQVRVIDDAARLPQNDPSWRP